MHKTITMEKLRFIDCLDKSGTSDKTGTMFMYAINNLIIQWMSILYDILANCINNCIKAVGQIFVTKRTLFGDMLSIVNLSVHSTYS